MDRTRGSRVRDWIFIVADAPTRVFDVRYQLELYEVFHTRPFSRSTHAIGITAGVLGYLLAATAWPRPFVGSGATLLTMILAIWYVGLHRRVGLWTLPGLGVLWGLALVGAAWLPEVGAAPLWAGLGLMVGGGTLCWIGHWVEPVPPPLSGSEGFVPIEAFVRGRPWYVSLYAFLAFPIWVFHEVMAAPKLFPYLTILWLAPRDEALGRLLEECRGRVEPILEGGLRAASPPSEGAIRVL